MTTATLDKRATFVSSAQVVEAPERAPLAPFVGYLVNWEVLDRTFEDKTTNEKTDSQHLLFALWPLTTVSQTYNTEHPENNGCHLATWRISKNANSMYAIHMKMLDAVLEQVLPEAMVKESTFEIIKKGKPTGTFAFASKPEHFDYLIENKIPMLWGGKDASTYAKFGEYAVKRHQVVPLGPPFEGWEDTIPADIETQRAAALAKGKTYADQRTVGHTTNGSSIQAAGSVVTETAPTIVLNGHEEQVLGLLRGLKKAEVINKVYGSDLPPEIKEALFGGAIQSALIAEGKLELVAGVYK